MRISSAFGCRRLPRAASPSARPDVGIGTRFMKSCIFAFRLWCVCGRALVLLLCGSCGFRGSYGIRYFLRFVCFCVLPYIVVGNKSIPKVLRNPVDTMSGLIHRQRASVKNEGSIMRQSDAR